MEFNKQINSDTTDLKTNKTLPHPAKSISLLVKTIHGKDDQLPNKNTHFPVRSQIKRTLFLVAQGKSLL